MTDKNTHTRDEEIARSDADSVIKVGDGDKSPGVKRIEAIVSTFNTTDRALLYSGLALSGFARGLSGLMLPAYQAAAISSWNAAGQSSTLSVARAAIGAASQPVWAKIMDNLGRTFVVFASTLFYILGYVVMACAPNFASLTGGLVLQVFGFGAQNISMYILIADTSSLRWRLLFSMIPSLHMIISFWASGVIAAKVMKHAGWRWGYGINTMIYPVLALPLFFVLAWTTLRAKRRGLLKNSKSSLTLIQSGRFWMDLFWQADVVGLIFLSASIALCLIPLTLGGGVSSKWKTAPVLAPLIVGFVVAIPGFIAWELKGARHPMLPFSLLKNRMVILSCALNMMYTITGSAQSSYLYFTLIVAFGKSVEVATRVSRLTSFVQALVGVALGFAIRYYRRPKVFTIIGCVLYLVAYGILYRFRGGHTESEFAGLIGGEVVLGFAMAIAQFAAQVGIQAVVKHEHVAIVTAVFFCCFQIGAGIGGAISGAIWTNLMPKTLLNNLQTAGVANATTIAAAVYGNPLKFVAQNLPGTPARVAVDEAYRHLNRLLCIAGLVFSGVCIFISLLLEDTELTTLRSIDDQEDWATNARTGTEQTGSAKLDREETPEPNTSSPRDVKAN